MKSIWYLWCKTEIYNHKKYSNKLFWREQKYFQEGQCSIIIIKSKPFGEVCSCVLYSPTSSNTKYINSSKTHTSLLCKNKFANDFLFFNFKNIHSFVRTLYLEIRLWVKLFAYVRLKLDLNKSFSTYYVWKIFY